MEAGGGQLPFMEQVAARPDPVGEFIREWTRPNGLHIRQVRVPLGVIGFIYEMCIRDRVSMEDPLYSFAGYSSTSSLRKTGGGTLGLGGISLCHFTVSVEGGTVRLCTNAGVRGMTRLDVAAGACLSFSLPRNPSQELSLIHIFRGLRAGPRV